ncbi:MAG: tRNA lysidine(34) synthetase TilS, partial [Bacteroidia bacterium]
MKVLKKVSQFIASNALAKATDKIICTVSGGKDSVAMLLLLSELGYNISIAHVNFNLRGNESLADQEFVKQLATKLNLPFYLLSANTVAESKPGESIQLAARRIRYNWFNKLLYELKYNKIATAHSSNDNAETIIYNLIKGSGIDGIIGIPPINKNVIRPILCLNTNEIIEYLELKNQPYRTDSSNSSDKYSRNKIRHHVIPVLQQINPAVTNTLLNHSSRFSRINTFYKQAINNEKTNIWTYNDNGYYKAKILPNNAAFLNTIIEHLLPLNFTETSIINIVNGNTSAQAISPKYKLLKDRNTLLLAQLKTIEPVELKIDLSQNGSINTPYGNLSWQINKVFNQQNLTQKNLGFISLDKYKGAAIIRNIAHADKMQPYGLKGNKLISDLLSDKKLNSIEKE